MTVPLAVALIALLIALFSLVALVAVYARVRALEAGRAAEVTGYAPLLDTPVPAAVAPRAGQPGGIVAVLDADCALCHEVFAALDAADPAGRRIVAVADRPADFAAAFSTGAVELLGDPELRADLFEGYSPTVLTVDAAGRVTSRTFVYADTDLAALLGDRTIRTSA